MVARLFYCRKIHFPLFHTAVARACGGAGFTIDDPATCGTILDQALNTPGPVVIEAVVDPFEPPMPAKIKPEQRSNLPRPLHGANRIA